jgi:hypothetical protein
MLLTVKKCADKKNGLPCSLRGKVAMPEMLFRDRLDSNLILEHVFE